MAERIICGVDGSIFSISAADAAAQLARALGVPVSLLNATGGAVGAPGFPVSPTIDSDTSDLIERLASRVVGAEAAWEVRGGDASAVLLAASREATTRMVVLGSRGRGRFASAVLGSVSASVPAEAGCPVMVVPPRARMRLLGSDRTIVCGVGNEAESDRVVEVAAGLSAELGARLIVVRVIEPVQHVMAVPAAGGAIAHTHELLNAERDAALASLDHATDVASRSTDTEALLETGDIAEHLCDVARQERAAFVVVGSRGHGPLRAALEGSVSRRLAGRGTAPVLIVPPA